MRPPFFGSHVYAFVFLLADFFVVFNIFSAPSLGLALARALIFIYLLGLGLVARGNL